jgi:hypothetical protein
MAFVIIESPILTSDQKARIGDKVTKAMYLEGIAPASVVVLFQPERGDLYISDHLFQASTGIPAPAPVAPEPAAVVTASDSPAPFKAKARRSKPELEDLKKQLMGALQAKGSLSSFEAQVTLELKDCDWAPATLRRLFTELEETKLIVKSGQKRGTRYVWKGIVGTVQNPPAVKLVKAESEES